MTDLEIINMPVGELINYEFNNKNHPEKQIDVLANSIQEFWFNTPIVIDNNNIIIAWHGRLLAAKKLWLEKVPVVIKENLTDIQIKKYRLLDNKIAELAEDNKENIKIELEMINDVELFELFDIKLDLPTTDGKWEDGKGVYWSMEAKFLIPPFSILDTTSGRWLERRRKWLELWIKSEIWRGENILWAGLADLAVKWKTGMPEASRGVSVFDPILCEIMYKWFNVEGGTILDPFAWGSVRGIMASKLGYTYVWNDLREEQVIANREQALEICVDSISPVWTVWDSRDIKTLVWNDLKADLLFTCPPYADLEVYSDNPNDLSNLEYDEFKKVYTDIIKNSCDILKDNRFAVIVVGEVRGKDGIFYNFVGDTINAFEKAWLHYYNEMILMNSCGTLPLRAWRVFNASRKIGKRHQNVLVFYKWDINKIKDNFKPFEDIEKIIEDEITIEATRINEKTEENTEKL